MHALLNATIQHLNYSTVDKNLHHYMYMYRFTFIVSQIPLRSSSPHQLFADDCTILTHMEESLQHIINHSSDAAEKSSLTISLTKTEVLYQFPPPQVAYSAPQINTDDTKLNAVDHSRTYPGSIISFDHLMPQSTRLFTTNQSKTSSSYGRLQKE